MNIQRLFSRRTFLRLISLGVAVRLLPKSATVEEVKIGVDLAKPGSDETVISISLHEPESDDLGGYLIPDEYATYLLEELKRTEHGFITGTPTDVFVGEEHVVPLSSIAMIYEENVRLVRKVSK